MGHKEDTHLTIWELTKDSSPHGCVFPRFVPRHDDELELEVNDPLLVEVQDEDYWYEGYNMRTGERGIFPAYYATEVFKEQQLSLNGKSWRLRWHVLIPFPIYEKISLHKRAGVKSTISVKSL